MSNRILFAMFGYNQMINIDYALHMSKYCRDFVYIDSFSDDKSDILLKENNVEVLYKNFIDWPSQRNFAYSLSRDRNFEWLFILDADELISIENIEKLYNYKLLYSAYFCTFDYYFDGEQLLWGGHRPRIRLVNVNSSEFLGNKIQEYVSYIGEAGFIKIKRLIYNNDKTDFFSILNKQIQRASKITFTDYNLINDESSLIVVFVKQIFIKPTILKAFLIFFYNYFIRGAFLDGKVGFKFSFANSFIFHFVLALNGKK